MNSHQFIFSDKINITLALLQNLIFYSLTLVVKDIFDSD